MGYPVTHKTNFYPKVVLAQGVSCCWNVPLLGPHHKAWRAGFQVAGIVNTLLSHDILWPTTITPFSLSAYQYLPVLDRCWHWLLYFILAKYQPPHMKANSKILPKTSWLLEGKEIFAPQQVVTYIPQHKITSAPIFFPTLTCLPKHWIFINWADFINNVKFVFSTLF